MWQGALASDPSAFASLFDEHHNTVFRQSLRLVDQPADAEEVTAAAFFELWRKRASVRLVNGSVLPWLLVTATKNLARNNRRALLRREALLRKLPREVDDDVSARAFDQVDRGIVRTDLVAALRRLKPQDVALLTLTALDGYPISEVAALLGLTEGAARVRLHRTRSRLRVVLTNADEGSTAEEVAR